MENKVCFRVKVHGLGYDKHSKTINLFGPRENIVFAPSALQRWTRGTMPTNIVLVVSFVLVLFNYIAWLWNYNCQHPSYYTCHRKRWKVYQRRANRQLVRLIRWRGCILTGEMCTFCTTNTRSKISSLMIALYNFGFNTKFYVPPTPCICVLYGLRTNIGYFPVQL